MDVCVAVKISTMLASSLPLLGPGYEASDLIVHQRSSLGGICHRISCFQTSVLPRLINGSGCACMLTVDYVEVMYGSKAVP